VDDPRLLKCWPADFRLTATYAVADQALQCSYVLENPDERPLPCGFGVHPYFCLPLGGDSAGACLVSLPVTSNWELAAMNATGTKTPLLNPCRFQSGLPFAHMKFDNVFGDLAATGELCRATISDPRSGRQLVMTFGREYRTCVVYTPPHREAICIEPYTCVPDPIRLQQSGIDAGLRVLAPGESFETHVRIELQ
jgi:aldose 1-epimerase